jgi:hypothetical protein
MAGALGVCIAAVYYIMMLRNMENARRKDLVFQRLQMPIQFFQVYSELLADRDITSYQALREKYVGKPEEMAKVWYVLNHFNSLGILVQEGLATPKQIFKQYLPISVILIYEKFKGEMINARYRHSPKLEVHNPDAYTGFEFLYNEAKRLYPLTPNGPWTRDELLKDAEEIDDLLKSEKTP